MPPYSGPNVTQRLDPGAALRLLVLVVLALALVVLDSRGGWLSQWRVRANALVQPVWALVGMPSRMAAGVGERISSHASLREENDRLRKELLVANARLVRLRAAAQDNARLRERLGAVERLGLDVQLVSLLDVDLDPVRQRLVLAAGSVQGVEQGQAVIDAGGLVGQVVEVSPWQSVVLLLTDPDHAIPVTVARNGVRLIAYGRGSRLELRDIPLSAEVQVGDEIVTSGLGGRFPAGFPVGKVTHLKPDDSHAFLIGELAPAARLDRGQEVMLLRPVPLPPNEPADTPAGTPVSAQAADSTALPANDPASAPARPAPARNAHPQPATPVPGPAASPAPPAGSPVQQQSPAAPLPAVPAPSSVQTEVGNEATA